MDWHALAKPASNTATASVLVVEDDVLLRDLWKAGLVASGFDVSAVSDVMSAMTLLADVPHVAVCDVHLPGANGLWLMEKIREISPTTAVVLATGDRRVPAHQSLRAGVIAYLVKPFALVELVSAVEEGVRWSALRRTQ